MARVRQPNLFETDEQSELGGEDTPTPEYRADPDSVRAELHKILAEARAAQKLPWEPRTVLPHHLPPDDQLAARRGPRYCRNVAGPAGGLSFGLRFHFGAGHGYFPTSQAPGEAPPLSCPGRGAAFFTLLRRAGTHFACPGHIGPGSAAHHAAKSGALRSIRGTRPGPASRKNPLPHHKNQLAAKVAGLA